MKVTLQDISDDTGFSISTVSRAVRGKGRISQPNRKKIIASARKLGYPVPENGPADDQNKTPSVAIITNFKTGEFYSSFFVGFIAAAKNKELNISLFSVDPDLEAIDNLIGEVRTLGYSAAVLFIPQLKEKQYRHILETKPKDFPAISCSNIDNSVLDTVTFDAYQGAVLVSKHFYAQGYRKLGIIEGPFEAPEARFRTNGFTDYVKQSSDAEITWVYPGDYTHESGISAFQHFHESQNKPEAIFATNDAMALGFVETARKAGYNIPEDVGLAGFDNLPFCEYHYPKITSVNTDYKLLAENTLDNLISRLRSENDRHQGIVSLVPVSLEIRESSISDNITEQKQKVISG
ncbi:MAG: LacI family DNA-binding transcriptional regulator [Balneolaceae bacterium]